MYAIPGPQLPVDAKNPSAGQIAIADDDTFWTISRSKLFRMRLGFTAQMGLQVTPAGLPVPSGVPMQSPQWNARRDTAFVAVRSEESDGMRAIAFDIRDGRALTMPATENTVAHETKVEGGAVYVRIRA